jgi:hypothetical protein
MVVGNEDVRVSLCGHGFVDYLGLSQKCIFYSKGSRPLVAKSLFPKTYEKEVL